MAANNRLLILTKGSRINPASRYRFYQFLPYLEEAGIQCQVEPFFDDEYYQLKHAGIAPTRMLPYIAGRYARRLKLLAGLKKHHFALAAVENQVMPYEPGLGEAILAARGVPFTLEFDDAIYLTRFHGSKLTRTLKAATHVIVGNQHLYDYAIGHTRKVEVVPTVVDMARYRAAAAVRKPKNRFVVSWIGLPVNFPYLATVEPALARLAHEFPLEFRVISAGSYNLPGVPVHFVPWSEEGEVMALAESHAGIMPLPDQEWERGKCGLKLIQYMATGLAAVCSPVGVNRDLVSHGRNGMLATTTAQWEQCLRTLCFDAAARDAMGEQARQTIEERYSLQSWGPRLALRYRELMGLDR